MFKTYSTYNFNFKDDKVAYPDFLNNRTYKWWIDQLVQYRSINISFDALWIDMK